MAVSIPESGELKHQIEIIRRIDLPLSHHQVKQLDTLIFSCWAKIEPTGALYWGTVQIEQKATHRFWMRTVAGKTDVLSINHGILIKCEGRFYRPTRVTDANGEGVFTLIEACEMSDMQPENNTTSSMMTESLS